MDNRLLIIGPSWVGDMVMAQSLFITLKKQQPQLQIDVLAPDWSLPILDRMPEVSSGIAMPLGHGDLELGTRYKIGKALRGKYQQSIALPNSLKSALVPFFAKIKKRTGWLGEARYLLLNDYRKLEKEAYPLMVQRFNALAYAPGAELPDPPKPSLIVDEENQFALCSKFGIAEKKTLVLCPGAEFGPSKKWPADKFAELAKEYLHENWQILLMGSANDRQACDEILEHIAEPLQADCVNLAGETRLVDTVDLLAMADAVVSNDSGLMHIAAAVAAPMAVIYGSTSPKFTPPLAEKVAIVRTGIECSPCFKRECPLGHLKCLKDLPVETVSQKLEKLTGTS